MISKDVSFTSRINFVSSSEFNKFRRGINIDYNNDVWLSGSKVLKTYTRPDFVKADEFYTDSVRTCTAGGVVDFKTGEAAGFHFYDSSANSTKVEELLDYIYSKIKKPDRALIIGGKDLKCAQYSMGIFNNIFHGLNKKIKDITVFKQHLHPYSETNFHYDLKNDTWTINSIFRGITDLKDRDILSEDDLKKCFKKIELANGDSLFINGEQINLIL